MNGLFLSLGVLVTITQGCDALEDFFRNAGSSAEMASGSLYIHEHGAGAEKHESSYAALQEILFEPRDCSATAGQRESNLEAACAPNEDGHP